MSAGPALARPTGAAVHRQGIFFVLFSAAAWSTAGLFTKGSAADAWTVLFWRGLFAGGFMLAYLESVGRERLWPGSRDLGLSGWVAVSISSAATFCFLNAFKLTSIANVTLIYAAIPFAAAAFGWPLLRERPNRATLLASVVALAGVGVMVAGSLGRPSLAGDGLALLMTVLMALYLTLIRRLTSRPMMLAAALSSLQVALFAWPFSADLWPGWSELAKLAAFGFVHAAALLSLTAGARLLPAAECAFLSALETPLAPLLAWLVLADLPAPLTFVGGGLVLAALLWYMVRELRQAQRTPG